MNPPSLSMFILFLLLFPTFSVSAQNTFDLDDLDQGQLVLNLNATEQLSVEQDTLNVSLMYSIQGRDSTELQNEVNLVIREARDILDDTDNIDWSIQQYHVYNIQLPRQNRNDISNPVWRAQQSVQLQSMNSEALLVVAARLQQLGLTISNMYYSLSTEKYQKVSDALLDSALLSLQARADRVASTLSKDEAELIEVNINGSPGFFGGRVEMAARASFDTTSAMAVPVAEPGETQVSVTVTARALLSP
jgi:predicted secreted protein